MNNFEWFKSQLSEEENQLLEKNSAIVNYRKRDVIIKKGEFVNSIPLVMSGFVKVEAEGRRNMFIIDIVPAVRLVGVPHFFGIDKHEHTIIALTDTTVKFFSLEVFKELIENNGKLALLVMNYCSQDVIAPLVEKLMYMNRNSIRGRLAKLLIHFSQDIHRSDAFTLMLSRHEIASMIGFSRENVIRMLSEFNSNEIISLKGKNLRILNIKKLEALAQSNSN